MKKALIVVAALAAGFAAFIMTRPGKFNVERSAKIDAPPDVVFAQLADFHNWNAWSPWDKKDPNMKRSFTGAASGKTASYAWEGDDKTGSGSMTITEAKPNEHVTIALEFTKPYKASNVVEFTLKPEGTSTDVRWDMAGGDDSFMSKAMATFMSFDKMIGPDFEAGLKNLKDLSEAKAKDAAKPPAPEAPAPAVQ